MRTHQTSTAGRIVVRPGRTFPSARCVLLIAVAELFFAAPRSALAQPAKVILLRHAEKPADPHELHLDERGRERAEV
jgi:hypothetical protein